MLVSIVYSILCTLRSFRSIKRAARPIYQPRNAAYIRHKLHIDSSAVDDVVVVKIERQPPQYEIDDDFFTGTHATRVTPHLPEKYLSQMQNILDYIYISVGGYAEYSNTRNSTPGPSSGLVDYFATPPPSLSKDLFESTDLS